MPLYDWTRVTDNVFHAFHGAWLAQLMGALNRSVLPDGYVARMEESLGTVESDVLALESGSAPPLPAPPANAPEPTVAIAEPRLDLRGQRRLAVFSAREERRVAVLEVLSPGNKDSEIKAGTFEGKVVRCLASGLHVLLIDLLAPTRSAPGVGAAIAREIGEGGVADGGHCTTSFEVRADPSEVRIYHRALALGEVMPDAPLFVAPGYPVDVPLEQTAAAALDMLPAGDVQRLRPA